MERPFTRLVGVAIALISAVVWAQSSYTAAVRGTVTDSTGSTIPVATVGLIEAERNIAHKTVTDEAGRYFFTALPPGDYTLTVEAKGFKKYSLTNLRLAVQQQATLDALLQVGDLATAVEVQGESPLLNTTISTMGQVIENRYMVTLPNIGRNPLYMLNLTPGVVG
ncbi:MAG TPA: carboxypeptidase-like regulatory domain-containing protein, partial [Candidatus Solibacter sp.]|nr:carboxypeptidase-like regulatory domain-containing protein [Candidatus Solibacter sp.]